MQLYFCSDPYCKVTVASNNKKTSKQTKMLKKVFIHLNFTFIVHPLTQTLFPEWQEVLQFDMVSSIVLNILIIISIMYFR